MSDGIHRLEDCPRHKRYKMIRHPTSDCRVCWKNYLNYHLTSIDWERTGREELDKTLDTISKSIITAINSNIEDF